MAFRANVDSETPILAANSTKRAFPSREGRAVMVRIEVARSLVMRMSASCSETRTLRYPAIKSIPTPPTYLLAEIDWPLVVMSVAIQGVTVIFFPSSFRASEDSVSIAARDRPVRAQGRRYLDSVG
jgi:hypothetical protein